jgi:outer membrane protein OmpA-like peptidoglycan-associated protein
MVAVFGAVLVPGVRADGYQLQQYEPTPAGDPWLAVQLPWYSDRPSLAAALTLNYGHKPLLGGRLDRAGDFTQPRPIVSDQFASHVDLAVAGWDRVQLAASLPVTAWEDGTQRLGVAPNSGAVVGDPRLGVMVRALGNPERDALSLHVGGALWVPIGVEDEHAGDSAARGLARVVLGGAASRNVLWATNLGVLFRSRAALNGAMEGPGVVGDELQLSAALGFRLLAQRLLLGPELLMGSVFEGQTLFSQQATHLEALGTASYALGSNLRLGAGFGAGLIRTAGTPDVRGLVRLSFAPGRTTASATGRFTTTNAERPQPKAAPAPEPEPEVVAEAPVQSEAEPTPPLAAVEPPPAEPAHEPEPPPSAAEPATPSPLTELPVLHFALGSAEPLDRATVHEIAEQLRAHPEVKRVRIHGHSDDSGNPQHNLELSRRRASGVASALAAEGIPRKKLEIAGFGSARPAREGTDDDARAYNRRVEFEIVNE